MYRNPDKKQLWEQGIILDQGLGDAGCHGREGMVECGVADPLHP